MPRKGERMELTITTDRSKLWSRTLYVVDEETFARIFQILKENNESIQQPATLPPAAKLPETCPQCAGELYNGYCQNCKATFEYAASAVHCWSTCSFKYTGIHETGCPAARPAQTGKG
jgi:hypothetical protein